MNLTLGEMELKFLNLIWDNEPIASGVLVQLCSEQFDWKKSTTYTVIKKLSNRHLIQNLHGTVTSLIGRDEYYSLQSKHFVEKFFAGSLPSFIAAFTKKESLSEQEIESISDLINSKRKEE